MPIQGELPLNLSWDPANRTPVPFVKSDVSVENVSDAPNDDQFHLRELYLPSLGDLGDTYQSLMEKVNAIAKEVDSLDHNAKKYVDDNATIAPYWGRIIAAENNLSSPGSFYSLGDDLTDPTTWAITYDKNGDSGVYQYGYTSGTQGYDLGRVYDRLMSYGQINTDPAATNSINNSSCYFIRVDNTSGANKTITQLAWNVNDNLKIYIDEGASGTITNITDAFVHPDTAVGSSSLNSFSSSSRPYVIEYEIPSGLSNIYYVHSDSSSNSPLIITGDLIQEDVEFVPIEKYVEAGTSYVITDGVTLFVQQTSGDSWHMYLNNNYASTNGAVKVKVYHEDMDGTSTTLTFGSSTSPVSLANNTGKNDIDITYIELLDSGDSVLNTFDVDLNLENNANINGNSGDTFTTSAITDSGNTDANVAFVDLSSGSTSTARLTLTYNV